MTTEQPQDQTEAAGGASAVDRSVRDAARDAWYDHLNDHHKTTGWQNIGPDEVWDKAWETATKHHAGERAVLVDLLEQATAVLRTIDPEDASEGELLEGLIARAEKACMDARSNGGAHRQ